MAAAIKERVSDTKAKSAGFVGDVSGKKRALIYDDEIATNTVYIPPEIRGPKLQILSVAPIFGEAIRRNFLRQSLGELFAFSDSQ